MSLSAQSCGRLPTQRAAALLQRVDSHGLRIFLREDPRFSRARIVCAAASRARPPLLASDTPDPVRVSLAFHATLMQCRDLLVCLEGPAMQRVEKYRASILLACFAAICAAQSSCDGSCPQGTERRGDLCQVLRDAGSGAGDKPDTGLGSLAVDATPEDGSAEAVGTDVSPQMSDVNIANAANGGASAMSSNMTMPMAMTMDAGRAAPNDGGDGMQSGPEMCAEEAAQRCSATQRGRELCEGGAWTSLDECASEELCTLKDGQPVCAMVADLCRGSHGEPVCDAQGTMLLCNEDGTLAGEPMPCGSVRLCQNGLAARSCAVCLAKEEYRCAGANLELCADDGMSFAMVEPCETEGLCNAIAGKCTTAACTPNTLSCQDNILQTCKADGTGFDESRATPCGDRTCDAKGGDCNMCEPGQKICSSNAVLTCDESGQQFSQDACPAGTKCVGAGQCVECEVDAECSGLDKGCTAGACIDYRCVPRPADVGTPCTTNARPGTCTSGGSCMCTPQCDKPCGADGCGGQCQNQCGILKCINDTCKACDPARGSLDCRQPDNPCQESVCQSDGSCSAPRPKASGTCNGVCLDGECVDCVTGRDCSSGHCTKHKCTECDQSGGCEERTCQRASCTSEGTCKWTPAAGARCGDNGMVCNSNGGCINPVYDRCTASGDIDNPSRACTTRGREGTCVDDGYCSPLCSNTQPCPPISGASVSCEYLCVIKCPCPDGMHCSDNNSCAF